VTAIGSLFAAGDAALTEIPDGRMLALTADAQKTGAAFRRYTADPLRVLTRWLVGRILALSIATVLLNEAASSAGLGRWALVVAVVGAVLFYGTFSEVTVTLARRRPERVGALALMYLRPIELLLVPLADPLAIVGRAVGRRVPRARNVDARITETEVEWVVSEGEKAGAMAKEPAEMIRKVLDFKDLTAREVMVPRRIIEAIDIATPLSEVVAMAAGGKHSRYPVYQGSVDNVVGQLYVKDLFALVRDGSLGQKKLPDVMRSPVMFVSESQSAAKILADMRSKRLHMAIVSDEFGGTSGLVTMEDILEEIVGDIRDEYDEEIHQIEFLADGDVEVEGMMNIFDLNERVDFNIPESGDYDTVGGFVTALIGRIPERGDVCAYHQLEIRVMEMEERRVKRVLFHKQHQAVEA